MLPFSFPLQHVVCSILVCIQPCTWRTLHDTEYMFWVCACNDRDAEGMKAASRMSHFPMSHDTAPVLVTFSRCLYAQLAQQRFSAPKVSTSVFCLRVWGRDAICILNQVVETDVGHFRTLLGAVLVEQLPGSSCVQCPHSQQPRKAVFESQIS